MERKKDSHVRDLADAVARERGISMDKLLEDIDRNKQRVAGIRTSSNGKFRVLWIDKYDGSDGVFGEYDTAKEALTEARKKTTEAKSLASSSSIATVYYAYDSTGKYLGGDTWAGE